MKRRIKVSALLVCLALSLCAFVACGKTEQKKTVVDAPVVAAKVYNGENQTADVAQNAAYTVVENAGGTNVGEYTVVLKLTDETKYEWQKPDESDATRLTLKFAITKAENSIRDLALDGWSRIETPKNPSATADFGTVTYAYSDAMDGTFSATKPTAAGTYYVKAYVDGTENYSGAEKVISFEITKAENSLNLTVADIVYNGTPAPNAVAGHNPVGGEVKVTYSLTADGDFVEWDKIEKRVGKYFAKAVADADDDYKSVTATAEFMMNKAGNAIADFTIAPVVCKQAPVLNAVASAGTAVTYKYSTSADGEYTEFGQDTDLAAGTYYVKAYTAGDDNYVSAESNPAVLTVNHAHVWKTDDNGNDYQQCPCGDDKRFVITPSEGAFTATATGYALTLYTATVGDKPDSVNVSFNVKFGDSVTENATVAFAQSPDGIVEVSGTGNYTVKAKAAGTTALTVTYTDDNGKKAAITVNVEVIRAVSKLSVRPVLEVEDLKTVDVPAEITDDITSVTIGGEDVLGSVAGGKITLDKAKLPKTAAKLGEKKMVIATANVDYELTVELYTLVIDDKTEFDKMRNLARSNGNYDTTGVLDGYFVLGSDIEYNGEFESLTNSGRQWSINNTYNNANPDDKRDWEDCSIYGFKGVFDGKGHNVNGLTVKDPGGNESGGLIGVMNNAGVFKNVSFTNAVVYEESGFICFMGGGLIENVQIQFKQLGNGGETKDINEYSPRSMGAFFTYKISNTAIIRNCVIDAIDAEIHFEIGEYAEAPQPNLRLGTRANPKNVTNLIVLCNGANSNAILRYSGASARAESYSAFKADEACQSAANALGDMWQVKSGLPFMNSLADKVDVDAAVDFADLVTTVNNGGSITFKANYRYSEFMAEDLYDGVTFENNVLAVADSAISGTVTVTVMSALNGTSKSAVITIRNTQTVAVPHEKVVLDKDAGEIDLSFASEYYTENARVTFGSDVLGDGKLNGGKLAVNLGAVAQTGDLTFKVTTDKNGVYYTFDLNVVFATKVIRNAADLEVVRVKSKTDKITGLYVLGNDIDMKGAKLSIPNATLPGYWEMNLGFLGTFDGRGHEISNFIAGECGLFGHVGSGAKITNVRFVGVSCNKEYLSAILGRGINGAEINNVTIGVVAYADSTDDRGLLVSRYTDGSRFIDVTIDASTCDVYSLFGNEIKQNTYERVTIKVKSYTQFGNQGSGVDASDKKKTPAGVTVIVEGA